MPKIHLNGSLINQQRTCSFVGSQELPNHFWKLSLHLGFLWKLWDILKALKISKTFLSESLFLNKHSTLFTFLHQLLENLLHKYFILGKELCKISRNTVSNGSWLEVHLTLNGNNFKTICWWETDQELPELRSHTVYLSASYIFSCDWCCTSLMVLIYDQCCYSDGSGLCLWLMLLLCWFWASAVPILYWLFCNYVVNKVLIDYCVHIATRAFWWINEICTRQLLVGFWLY